MPIYEYRCRKCGKQFEKLVRVTTPDEEVDCPSCGVKEAERMLSLFAAFGGGAGGGCATGSGSGFG